MNDTSGPMLPTPLAHYDPALLCWRTSQGTFPWEAPQLLETLPAWGITRGGVLFERPTPARLTAGRDSSSLLPTTHASMATGTWSGNQGAPNLQTVIAAL